MPLDPISPGAMPTASVTITAAQMRKLAEVTADYDAPVRIEKLQDAYARAVVIGPDGDAIAEYLLFPV